MKDRDRRSRKPKTTGFIIGRANFAKISAVEGIKVANAGEDEVVQPASTKLKLVGKKELKSVYGIPYSFQHIARLEAAGKFPKRLRLGECRVAWLAGEIEAWIYDCASRRATTAS